MNQFIYQSFKRKVIYHLARMARKCLPLNPDLRVTVLFVYADLERYGFAHHALDMLLTEFNPATTHLIKINNWQPDDPLTSIGHNRHNVGGDNSAWEFSAWDKGIRAADTLNIQSDIVLFFNDALFNSIHQSFDMHYFSTMYNHVTLSRLSLGVLGHVDQSELNCAIHGMPSVHHMRSNSFAITSDLLPKIRLTYYDAHSVSEFLPEKWTGQLFTEHAPLSSEFKTFLTWWMTKGWPRSAEYPLCQEHWPLIRAKLTAILNERMLSIQLQQAGARFYVRGNCSRITGVALPELAF